MRVIAGRLGGRLFDSPGTHRTHPMSDRVRGALFNVLGDIEGLTVLDAFSGSGALAFEAVSRGAKHVLALDNDKNAQNVIAKNIASLGVRARVTLVRASANAWLGTNGGAMFDIVLCDPPYNELQINLLHKLLSCVRPEGIFVLSWPSREPVPEFASCELIDQRSYGDAQLLFFRLT